MKTLQNIMEGVLDAEFDISDDDILPLMGNGYICTKCVGNAKFWEYAFSMIKVGNTHFKLDILAAAKIAREYSQSLSKMADRNPQFRMNDIVYLVAYMLSMARATEEEFIQAFNDTIQPSAKRIRSTYEFKKTNKMITFNAEWPQIKAKVSLTFKKV